MFVFWKFLQMLKLLCNVFKFSGDKYLKCPLVARLIERENLQCLLCIKILERHNGKDHMVQITTNSICWFASSTIKSMQFLYYSLKSKWDRNLILSGISDHCLGPMNWGSFALEKSLPWLRRIFWGCKSGGVFFYCLNKFEILIKMWWVWIVFMWVHKLT